MVEARTICRRRPPARAAARKSVGPLTRAGSRDCRKYKNSGNELTNLLKTKQVTFSCRAKRTQNELKSNWFFTAKNRNLRKNQGLNSAPFPGWKLREGATWNRHLQSEDSPQRASDFFPIPRVAQTLHFMSLHQRKPGSRLWRIRHDERCLRHPSVDDDHFVIKPPGFEVSRVPAAQQGLLWPTETLTRPVSS